MFLGKTLVAYIPFRVCVLLCCVPVVRCCFHWNSKNKLLWNLRLFQCFLVKKCDETFSICSKCDARALFLPGKSKLTSGRLWHPGSFTSHQLQIQSKYMIGWFYTQIKISGPGVPLHSGLTTPFFRGKMPRVLFPGVSGAYPGGANISWCKGDILIKDDLRSRRPFCIFFCSSLDSGRKIWTSAGRDDLFFCSSLEL